MHKNKGERPITGIVRKKLMAYLEKNEISVYRFAKDSGIPQSTIWSSLEFKDIWMHCLRKRIAQWSNAMF